MNSSSLHVVTYPHNGRDMRRVIIAEDTDSVTTLLCDLNDAQYTCGLRAARVVLFSMLQQVEANIRWQAWTGCQSVTDVTPVDVERFRLRCAREGVDFHADMLTMSNLVHDSLHYGFNPFCGRF